MKDALEYLMILIFVAVLAAATLKGALIEPASRLLNQLAATIATIGS